MTGPQWSLALPPVRVVTANQVSAELTGAPRLVVLDDDPTGTQTVRDVPVLTRWHVDDVRWALQQDTAGFFVLTNSRSQSPEAAAARNREVATVCFAAARAEGVRICFASRSDSTLRGHFPLETDVLAEVIAAQDAPVDGVLLSPAYLDAGRVTVDATHWIASAAGLTPVGDSEFARDASFGYQSSRLPDWVQEKSGGRVAAGDVGVLSLADIRCADQAGLDGLVAAVSGGRTIVVEAANDADLRAVSLAVLRAEAAGRRLLFRVGPSFVRARLGQPTHPPVPDEELRSIVGTDAHGLVVVGSHVGLTNRQLERLRERRSVTDVVIEAAAVFDEAATAAHLAEVVDLAGRALADGLVVVSTSRTLLTGADSAASLEIAHRISAAVTETTRRILASHRPAFLLAKGGITSSDVATSALGMTRAWVRGSMLPGIVSVWESAAGPARGLPYLVFAGNVGDDLALADVVDRLEAAR